MKAARFYTAGDVRIEQVAAPDADLGPGEVLVRNRECGICGTDLHEYRHGPVQTCSEPHATTRATLPQILGHEFSGVVEAVGPGVRTTKVGDRVAIMPQVFCGQCAQCMAGRQQCCLRIAVVGLSWPWGGFSEYAVLREELVATLPDTVSDAAGALVEPAAVAVHAVSGAGTRPGDSFLVTGGGPIAARRARRHGRRCRCRLPFRAQPGSPRAGSRPWTQRRHRPPRRGRRRSSDG